ncbi:response regulator transcription factor [Agaribacter marinus]|nr:response regulator transcription factor [Agaribacter marinus]
MKAKPTLLIIEDEPYILRGLTDLFVFHGYHVDSEMDGQNGLNKALEKKYSCILLDLMLPSMNGFEVCDIIRQSSQAQPIIMLTAKNSEEDVINGLTLGADDYLAKPFSTSELVLRVNGLVRRSAMAGQSTSILIGDHVRVCTQTLVGTSYQQKVQYTRREVAILSYLNEQSSFVSRTELLRQVWGYKSTEDVDTRTVDIHIARIRKKIEKNPRAPAHLVTFRGEGYQLFCSPVDV